MSDDPILAALARRETGQNAMRVEAAGFREQVLNRLNAIREAFLDGQNRCPDPEPFNKEPTP
jgi:hypothetical protein